MSGPLLEFGETRAEGVGVAYKPAGSVELDLMFYRGTARPEGGGARRPDWAAAIEAHLRGGWLLGLSYQSDLADSEDALLADSGDRYARRVDAASGFVAWTSRDLDVSFEILGALRPFKELEEDRDQPLAWNLELAHFAHRRFDWALRWEGSRQLEDAPKRQLGVALTWRPVDRASLTVEYLHGWFSGGLATNDEDEP